MWIKTTANCFINSAHVINIRVVPTEGDNGRIQAEIMEETLSAYPLTGGMPYKRAEALLHILICNIAREEGYLDLADHNSDANVIPHMEEAFQRQLAEEAEGREMLFPHNDEE